MSSERTSTDGEAIWQTYWESVKEITHIISRVVMVVGLAFGATLWYTAPLLAFLVVNFQKTPGWGEFFGGLGVWVAWILLVAYPVGKWANQRFDPWRFL